MLALIDSGPLIAYYNLGDSWHARVKQTLEQSTFEFVTTESCVTEVMWHLQEDVRVQNEFLLHLSRGLYKSKSLIESDYARIAELNLKYKDRPADFADLSLIVIAERLNINTVFSLDNDFEIYRFYGTKHFSRMPIIIKKRQ